MDHAYTATPAKLHNGNWGAKVQGKVVKGDIVTITTRSGKSWDAIVQRVVWSGEGVCICATESMDRTHVRPQVQHSYRRECCGYPCPVTHRRCTSSDPCHDCQ